MKKQTILQTKASLATTGSCIMILANAGIINAQTAAPGPILAAATIPNGSITTRKLAKGCVTQSRLDSSIGVWLANGPEVFHNGKVGIGTSAPSSKLDVIGTVSASGLRAPGAGINTGTFAFVHKATAGSITGYANHITAIDNPLCNGDPNAILIVTHNWTKDTSANAYHPQVVGVYFIGGKWRIFHEDNTTAMQSGDAFNVMVIKP